MASGSKTASGDKKKAKKSSRSSAEASSRNKDRKSKDKKSSSKKEKPTVTTELAPPSPVPTPPLVHDPDAIQLFRRYDRNRSGVLTRLDFLQLLKDYADPASGWSTSTLRPPLSLTDTNGIPLGYQRADRNSEFEAGQLFERYDKDHTGALNLDRFHVFFADFKSQLRAFVEESNYRSLAPPAVTVTPAPLLPVQEEEPVAPTTTAQDAASGADDAVPSPKTMRAQYRAALWKLRRIYKDELIDQRDSIAQQMKTIRENIASRQRESNRSSSVVRWGDSRRSKQSLYPEFDNDDFHDESGGGGITETKQYEAMEDDLDRLDELMRYVRRYLSKGDDVSRREMQDFLEQAESIEEEAQCLAMKDYGRIVQRVTATPTSTKEKENDPPSAPTSTSAPVLSSATPPSEKQTSLQSLLRVKDQMIYQLLQERTSMRKERAAVEASLKKLSDVSTREMKKWARLTDDMQAEIEQLRSQLRSQSQQRAVN
ncbi:hypothetical protein PRNP1_004515 [Phytophthora ramorum]